MVELFAANIQQIAPRAESLVCLLSEERQARVRAFGTSGEALRRLAAGLLLYHVFGEGARSARFERGGRGKPSLPNARPYNLTHSGDFAVLAVSSKAVGVDLERIRPIDWQHISARFFHPDERAFLAESSNPESAFFWIWTLKESYLKAEGLGFSVSPARFSILPQQETEAVMSGQTGYRFRRYHTFAGYCMSLCCTEESISEEVRLLTF
ncbi:MAG: 4'-phosphopantetheinyl transferase superfamily protein [Eubacteriales bacterium]|nr:4'-phosphopantetheinyl transferase superfamily protein [Eubacteriales bacterium]